MTRKPAALACMGLTLLLAAPLAALGQGLPVDVGDTLGRVVDDRVVRQVERTVDGAVDRTLEKLDLPDLPVDLADPLGRTSALVEGALGTVDSVAKLPGIVRTAPGRAVELDEAGGWPVIRDEWVLIADDAEAARLKAEGVRIVEDTRLETLDARLLIVSLAADDPRHGRIEALLRELGAETADRNHVYRPAGGAAAAVSGGAKGATAAGSGSARIGLIDTDVDETHPALKSLALAEADFVTIGELRPQGHGTAVASILAHELPGAQPVQAASVFFLSEDGTTGATSASLVRAMDWMIAQKVAVINFSLTGPPNKALEKMVKAGQEAGIVIVAAVGNDGPAARPLYPAAYPGVVGVTAVDADGKIYRWANRGEQVAVAARGVDVEIARPGGATLKDSGTSFAAPIVSAWFARALANEAGGEPMRLIQAAAQPAGKGERDQTYGFGILDSVPSR